jgi:dTDP-4-dehydrorhamnose 3,5-epimerase
MKFIDTPLEGLLLIEPKVFTDSRGYFLETFSEKIFNETGISLPFVQDNQSFSYNNVLRGLHFQKPPYEQGKLVRVVKGSALDVAVDIRKNSKTFGRHFSVELNERNKQMLWIPPGFAHGFVALEDGTLFLYKVTAYYNPAADSGIIYNDPELNIDWRISSPVVSQKDLVLPSFREYMMSNA